ncbi:PASTA domain-containing protein [Streptomyces sp. NBC_00878]|uniref:PASTA domain-containing protein n=1 Tax=Streptomyces sp. NBC_00878 TaxID=2975854 RepID=UPI00225245F2|nr:PASTA domain-containing protein [Streptomyces sp. NBC_00878]MCX4908480.1 PASTA domain-containing protein [Streptomyces sp. NBC_00878]
MNTRTAVALAATALLVLAACEAQDTSPQIPAPTTSQESTPPRDSAPSATTDPSVEEEPSAAEAETAMLPDMTGKVLQAAQDEAQALGFYSLTSSDATGQGRFQAFDRNWKVCSQTPEPGEHPVDTTIDFATVKLSESC